MTEPKRTRIARTTTARRPAARPRQRVHRQVPGPGSGRQRLVRPIPADGDRRVVVEAVRPHVDDGRFAVKRTVGEIARGAGRRVHPTGMAAWRACCAIAPRAHRRGRKRRWIRAATTCGAPRSRSSSSGFTNTPSRHGSTRSARGAASWPRRPRPARTSRASCSRARSSCAPARRAPRAGSGAWLEERATVLRRGLQQSARVAAGPRRSARGGDGAGSGSHPRGGARPGAARVGGSRARAFRRLVRDVPAFRRPRSGAQRARSARPRRGCADIAAMGFDVVYLPPIHPIGRSHPQGTEQHPGARPGDPGSPWAIGAAEGGHMAIEPGLGTLDDFDRFVARAAEHRPRGRARHRLPVLARPSVRRASIPGWFRHRPDGTIKYAENPPKKYQDIYPIDFECDDWRGAVGRAARGRPVLGRPRCAYLPRRQPAHQAVPVLGLADRRGAARASRRDLPRRGLHAAASVMRRLAKVGFTQSYSYFTWRNRKDELVEYFTELTATPVREFMRPNLFANTPDILHEYLQTGGRGGLPGPARARRDAGCHLRHLRPGVRAVRGPCGAGLRGIRGLREVPGPALGPRPPRQHPRPRHGREPGRAATTPRSSSITGCGSIPSTDDELIFYSKSTPDGRTSCWSWSTSTRITSSTASVHVPIGELGLPADQPYEVHDLLSDQRYLWSGERNYVRLDPP